MRDYVIVVRMDDDTIVQVVESEPLTSENVWDVSGAVSDLWYRTSREYPPTEYDIIWGTADSFEALREAVGRFKGWDSVGVTPVPIEVAKEVARVVYKDAVLQEVGRLVVEGEAEDIAPAVKKALASKAPLTVITDGLIAGMKEVSRLWDEGLYFLPQVILAADAMNAGIALCEGAMGKPMARKGEVVTHTAEGDIHDIGQVIANALLNAGGFEVINLGCDVPVDTVVAAVKEHKPILVTGTALMTTTMTAFSRICSQLKSLGINTPFISAGGAVAPEWATSFDLSVYAKEDSQACPLAEDALSGMSWQDMRAKWNA